MLRLHLKQMVDADKDTKLEFTITASVIQTFFEIQNAKKSNIIMFHRNYNVVLNRP